MYSARRFSRLKMTMGSRITNGEESGDARGKSPDVREVCRVCPSLALFHLPLPPCTTSVKTGSTWKKR